jgi:hypothetical protein
LNGLIIRSLQEGRVCDFVMAAATNPGSFSRYARTIFVVDSPTHGTARLVHEFLGDHQPNRTEYLSKFEDEIKPDGGTTHRGCDNQISRDHTSHQRGRSEYPALGLAPSA